MRIRGELEANGFEVVTVKIHRRDGLLITIDKKQVWSSSLKYFQTAERKRSDPVIQEAVQKVVMETGGGYSQQRNSQQKMMKIS
ncbi:hypothetical protein ACF0H5_001464 [Mactra antiquata]